MQMILVSLNNVCRRLRKICSTSSAAIWKRLTSDLKVGEDINIKMVDDGQHVRVMILLVILLASSFITLWGLIALGY